MNVVDSSAWLEYFADGPHAAALAEPVENARRLVVPSICVYEVFRRIAGQRDERTALDRVSYLLNGRVVDLTAELAILAARVGLEHRLPQADSIVYATALANDAVLWTMDGDFNGLEGVRYFTPR